MLVLGVRKDDYIMIDDNIKIRILRVGDVFKVAIDAPREMLILRKTLYEKCNPGVDDSEYAQIKAAKELAASGN